jgi:nucleotide-binding universal stress UspA family protein
VARNGKSNPWNGHRPGASIRASEARKADRVLEHRRGVDHWAHSREAARFAAGLAERLGLRLVIAHALSATVPAFHPTSPGQASPDEDEGVSRTRHAGERLVSELVKSGGVRDTSGRVEIGLAPECLRAIAEEESAEFVAVGTKGAGTARLVLMGSVSLATVRIARCPVVVVPPAVRLEPLGSFPAQPIVCGIGHPGDAEPVRVAARLARELHLTLLPTHVVSTEDDATASAAVAQIRERWTERLAVRAGEPSQQLAQVAQRRTRRWWWSELAGAARSARARSAPSHASWHARVLRRSWSVPSAPQPHRD